MPTRIPSAIALSLCIFTAVNFALGDVVTLTSGRVIQGTVIQKDKDSVSILADYGVTSVPANIVQNIKPEADRRPTTLSKNTVSSPGRIPDWGSIVTKLADKAWADKLRQIPATVITSGVLSNVPYISFRCGTDYEVNIYGDLDNPAGVEVGFYRTLLSPPDRKDYAAGNAVGFVSSILPNAADRAVISGLNLQKDSRVRDGLTFEVTPETDADAYGGWWVSVYDAKALDQARATDAQLKEISVLNSAVMKQPEVEDPGTAWTKQDLKYARPAAANPAAARPSQPAQTVTYVTSTPAPASSHPDVAPEHDHGSVYVQGYYKKNGTYVSPYTRKK